MCIKNEEFCIQNDELCRSCVMHMLLHTDANIIAFEPGRLNLYCEFLLKWPLFQ